MEEARRLLARLERIEALDRRRAAPADLLAELQALLTEADAWARAEHPVPNEAIDAVDRCRNLLCRRKRPAARRKPPAARRKRPAACRKRPAGGRKTPSGIPAGLC
jgi:hypothetical protein